LSELDPASLVVAQRLAALAVEKKADDVVLLDMHALVDYCDVFVLLTARNRRHVAALAEDLRMFAKKELHLQALGIEGLPAARWVLVDFGSVVVHLFDEPLRGFYDLDGLWSDAPRLPAAAASATGEPATPAT
jgi:ribosome-associated protein